MQDVEAWIKVVEKDLEPFADGRIQIRTAKSRIFARWQIYDIERTAEFEVTDRSLIWIKDDGSKDTYKSFIASPDVGNLQRLARAISDKYNQVQRFYSNIPARARRLNQEQELDADATTIVLEYLLPHQKGDVVITDVIFVKGGSRYWKDNVSNRLNEICI